MGKQKAEGNREVTDYGGEELLALTGSADHTNPSGVPKMTPAALRPTDPSELSDDMNKIGMDLRELQDTPETNFDGDPTRPLEHVPPEQFILAQFVSAPLNPTRDYEIRHNGVTIRFLRGRWMVTRAKYVTTALQSGTLDFIPSARGRTKTAVPNYPTFNVKSLPDNIRTDAEVKAWLEKCRAMGREIPVANADF